MMKGQSMEMDHLPRSHKPMVKCSTEVGYHLCQFFGFFWIFFLLYLRKNGRWEGEGEGKGEVVNRC
jgi:hypothetical protein